MSVHGALILLCRTHHRANTSRTTRITRSPTAMMAIGTMMATTLAGAGIAV